MALSARLQQKQSQSLVMTPQLAQSIKLLQYSHIELSEFVREEIEKNPLLELDSDNKTITNEVQPENISSKDETISNEMKLDAGEKAGDLDASFENVYDEGIAGAEKSGSDNSSLSSGSISGSSSSSNAENADFLASVGETLSLAQHLGEQIMLAFSKEQEREVARHIAHALTDDGYFQEDLQDIARLNGVSLSQAEAVLQKFQTLEPTGIGARNLHECLSIQLREKDRFDPAMEKLLANLPLLAKREFEKLMKVCEVDREDFNDMIREIKELDPRPAAKYEPILAANVVPDVLIRQKTDGSWAIDLNPETLPKVLVNHTYHAELTAAVKTPDGKEFIAECMGNASWLTKSLDQRAQTILKVATEIVKQQDMFFAEGVEHLRPLNLKTVADSIKMHESTISRVTANKYLMCDRGIFELKYFFSSSITASGGEEGHASQSVKHKIKQMVDAENPKKVLSDDQIVLKLQETGIEIARRTVAKYRDALRIPSSVQRRREKQMQA
jgi:RNA polymerase sigma-54 factor